MRAGPQRLPRHGRGQYEALGGIAMTLIGAMLKRGDKQWVGLLAPRRLEEGCEAGYEVREVRRTTPVNRPLTTARPGTDGRLPRKGAVSRGAGDG